MPNPITAYAYESSEIGDHFSTGFEIALDLVLPRGSEILSNNLWRVTPFDESPLIVPIMINEQKSLILF